ncbi:FliG C-terminal domain-containing protein, partial [Balneolaceae bacterium ANBcel3]|nr:FliG C-terminal domain-containing protein [Balneolaceae bacterium ANBcel3]
LLPNLDRVDTSHAPESVQQQQQQQTVATETEEDRPSSVRRTEPNASLERGIVTVIEKLEVQQRVYESLQARLNNHFDPAYYTLDVQLEVSSRSYTMEIPLLMYRQEEHHSDERLPALPFMPPDMVKEQEATVREEHGRSTQYIRMPDIDRFLIEARLDTMYQDEGKRKMEQMISSMIRLDGERGDRLDVLLTPFERVEAPVPVVTTQQPLWYQWVIFGIFINLLLIVLLFLLYLYMYVRREKNQATALPAVQEHRPHMEPAEQKHVPASLPQTEIRGNGVMASPKSYIMQVVFHQPEKIGRLFSYWNEMDPENGLKKAAVIIQSVDPKIMGMLRSSMPEEVFRDLEELVCSPKLSSFGKREALLEQFAEQLRIRQQLSGSRENFAVLPTFDFLHYMNDEHVYELLMNESDRAKALTLTHLPDKRKVQFLQRLDVSEAAHVLYAITQVRSIPFEEYEQVASRLFEESYYKADNRDNAKEQDAKHIASIIEALPASDQEAYVRQLEHFVPELADEVRKHLVTMDRLAELSDETLEKAVDRLSDEELAAVLVGTEEALKKRLLKFRPGREEQKIRAEIENMVFLSREEIDQVRSKFLKIIRSMAG